MIFVAEVKTRSPFGFQSELDWDSLFEIANEFGDIVAVHTDPRWGGSFDLLREAVKRSSRPILAKGIHATDAEVDAAFDAGATWVLVVGRYVNNPRCWIEPTTLYQLGTLPERTKAVWNERDLTTGRHKGAFFDDARMGWDWFLCQASFIAHPRDVRPEADGYIVGSHLPTFVSALGET